MKLVVRPIQFLGCHTQLEILTSTEPWYGAPDSTQPFERGRCCSVGNSRGDRQSALAESAFRLRTVAGCAFAAGCPAARGSVRASSGVVPFSSNDFDADCRPHHAVFGERATAASDQDGNARFQPGPIGARPSRKNRQCAGSPAGRIYASKSVLIRSTVCGNLDRGHDLLRIACRRARCPVLSCRSTLPPRTA